MLLKSFKDKISIVGEDKSISFFSITYLEIFNDFEITIFSSSSKNVFLLNSFLISFSQFIKFFLQYDNKPFGLSP
ncbi:hypothetical protein CRV00_09885 [Malaciobacter molluscorum]|nr:hypothetical protein CRV00_09885 [Malaciobacter molluscorum]